LNLVKNLIDKIDFSKLNWKDDQYLILVFETFNFFYICILLIKLFF
jgi:hypothetical protein